MKNSEIKKVKSGFPVIIKDDVTDGVQGLWLRITWDKGKINRTYYLRFRIKGGNPPRTTGILGYWNEAETKEDEDLYTIEGAREYARKVKKAGRFGQNLLATRMSTSSTSPKELKHKLKEFFEDILFNDAQRAQGVKLKLMSDKDRLTYLPERVSNIGRKFGRSKLVGVAEPAYFDWKLQAKQPKKYPVVDRSIYWDYVSCYNNWIVSSEVKAKVPGHKKARLLKNINHNQIPQKAFKLLHKEILKKGSGYRANDVLEMLRVFYNWCINNKDKYIQLNPVTEALSTKKFGPRNKKLEGGTWAKTKRKKKTALTDDEIDAVLMSTGDLMYPNPTSFTQRHWNRSMYFIRFRFFTGARPDVGKYLTWEMLDKDVDEIEVVSKGGNYDLKIRAAKKLVFNPMKATGNKEPDHRFVFSGYSKSGAQTGSFKSGKPWRRVCKEVGIKRKVDFYDIKHTAFTTISGIEDYLYAAKVCGIDPKTAAEFYYLPQEEKVQQKIEQHFSKRLKLVASNK